MTNEKAIEILEECWRYAKTYKYTDAEIREAFDMAIKALEQQPCKDCISRADVLNMLKGIEILHYHDELRTNLIYGIMNLPSVTPKAESEE